MVEKQQDKATEAKDVSPLVRDKTYGERVYNSVFNKGLNFWVNLLASAGFSLFASNYAHKIKLPGMKTGATPSDIQNGLITRIQDSWIIKSMKTDNTTVRHDRAKAISEVFTLLIPGHVIMIPSVWLGAKIKPAFVRYFDKKHYGENAEQDPSIAYRHDVVDAEERPTLLGAVVGRIGTMATTMTASRLIGSKDNFVNTVGKKQDIESLKNFKGINPIAKQMGEVIGGGAVEKISVVSKLNDRVSKNLDWPTAQRDAAKEAGLTLPTYKQGLQDYTGFVAMDTLYTLITASVIHPIMAVLRHVPGMTYTTRPPVDKQITTETGDTTKLRVPKNRMAVTPALAEEAAPQAPMVEGQPKINVSEIKHLERINNSQKEMNAI